MQRRFTHLGSAKHHVDAAFDHTGAKFGEEVNKLSEFGASIKLQMRELEFDINTCTILYENEYEYVLVVIKL